MKLIKNQSSHRTAFQVALALTSYSALSCAAAVGGRCAVGYRSTQLRVRGKRAPVASMIRARDASGDVIIVVVSCLFYFYKCP